jgi:hypothetical protein
MPSEHGGGNITDGDQPIEVARLRITDAGRRAIRPAT